MLFRKATLEAIARSDVTVAFRRWGRATVKTGHTLRTAVGVLAIERVDVVDDVSEADALTDADVADVDARLARFDKASRHGPWTRRYLELLRDRPGVRAVLLAGEEGRDLRLFKRDVRKLKELGLTESLKVGYRLSPRGRAYLERTEG